MVNQGKPSSSRKAQRQSKSGKPKAQHQRRRKTGKEPLPQGKPRKQSHEQT
jgi:hypothetical protein